MKKLPRQLSLAIVAIVLSLVVIGWLWWQQNTSASCLISARTHQKNGNYAEAFEDARRTLDADPGCDEAQWIAGDSARRLRRYSEASDHLLMVSEQSTFAVQAYRTGATISERPLFRLKQAAEFYRRLLAIKPDDTEALSKLAQLLALTGQREEAKPLIFRLIQLHQPSDLLIVLSRETAAVQDEPFLRKAIEVSPNDPYVLLGLARTEELKGNSAEAIRLTRAAIQCDPQLAYGYALLGRYLIEDHQTTEFQTLMASLPQQVRSDARVLQLEGRHFFEAGEFQQAWPFLIDAAKAIPESHETLYRLAVLLKQVGESERADRCQRYMKQTQQLIALHDQVLFSDAGSDPAVILRLIEASIQCGRILEASGWAQLAVQRFHEDPTLAGRNSSLLKQLSEAAPVLVQPTENPLEDFRATPNLTMLDSKKNQGSDQATTTGTEGDVETNIRFITTGPNDGLDFTFQNGDNQSPSKRMFELTGGGVAAVDFDHDSYTDVVMTQGNHWDRPSPSENDVLFRNQRALRFATAPQAGFGLPDFSQGVASGDLDQDGFPDFVTTSTEGATIWWNQGDGTFQASPALPQQQPRWMTSCAVVDLNQDSLPEILLEGYLRGDAVFSRVCNDGAPGSVMCMPSIFEPEPDLLLANQGNRTFVDVSERISSGNEAGKGLGLLVFSGDDRTPQILIANDTTPNQLLSCSNSPVWQDTGFEAGISLSGQGRAEGSMGIAFGDPDQDQDFDLVITNFLTESHAFYSAIGPGKYQDLRRRTGLQELTQHVLGFGTQFIDADNDGCEELFLSNGHIDNLESRGKPWKMPAQMMRWHECQFQNLPTDQLGPYFAEEHLGRAAARLDWNADGKPDLLLGNLYEPSVILTNSTQNAGNSLSFVLIGRTSSRDGTLATVRTVVNQRPVVRQITAGDGYQCSNEKLIHIGIGRSEESRAISVRWPSGIDDSISPVATSGRWIVREGEGKLWEVPF